MSYAFIFSDNGITHALKFRCERFEVFTAVTIQVKVFWVVTHCRVALGYQHFRGPCCLHPQGEMNSDGKKRHRYRLGVQEGSRCC